MGRSSRRQPASGPRPYPDPPLQGARFRLRPHAESDIPAIVAACQHASMPRFLTDLPWPYDQRDARAWLAAMAASRAAGDAIDLAIAEPDGDRMIGTIGATHLAGGRRTAVIGYWLAAEARGRGVMAEALGLLTRWLFSAAGIERIELTTAPDNIGSQRVAAAAGFRLEGYARREQRFARDGQRRDSLLYALLPEDLAVRPGTRPRIVWLNGPFAGGKTSAAAELKRRRPEVIVYDPEHVGALLRGFISDDGDFQNLPEWRDVVIATGASLARHQPGGVVAPMTLWRQEYLTEIFTGLRAAGVEVTHVLLDAPDAVIGARIDGDLDDPAARRFRRERLPDYTAARGWLRAAADLVIDTATLGVGEVTDRLEPLLD